ncbi:phosphopentomutase [Verrucomicrobia bacterium]|nr:phosphopentomutase [Verrucomicrobiota bacterium]
MNFSRVTVIVLDGVGMGAAPDAEAYGDSGSHSFANTARVVGGLNCPNMAGMGLGCIDKIDGIACVVEGVGGYGKMTPRSSGKDTVTGHWELMGVQLETPFPTYPNGFPDLMISSFETAIGRKVIGNVASSGTAILDQLGEEHVRTGNPIVYTSADSVFQIAAHEDVVPVSELHEICERARAILVGEHGVGRVIARPFIGNGKGAFVRTSGRRDYPLPAPSSTLLDHMVSRGLDVLSVGKIDDIFGHRGITQSNHTPDNASSMDATLSFLDDSFQGLLFVNLIDCDMIYGHRNDPHGFAKSLESVDRWLPEVMNRMGDEDLLILSADHGVDPTTPGTDHSREFVPLLVWSPILKGLVNLGVRKTFADVARTVVENFGLDTDLPGESFLTALQSSFD